MNIIQENNWVITTKKGKVKVPLFRGNIERVILIYGLEVALMREHKNSLKVLEIK